MARQVMIMGCGRVGAMVATALLDGGDEVTILDTEPENFRRMRPSPSLRMIVADGTSMEALRDAGVESTDVFIALAPNDTTNALAAQMAQTTFGVDAVVCRVNDPVRREMYEELGLRPVSPTQITTELVLDAIGR